MSKQIIKQPNNLYGIFSTVVDDWVAQDLTEDNVLMFFVEEAQYDAENRTRNILNKIKNGLDPYHGLGHTYEDIQEILEEKKEDIFPVEYTDIYGNQWYMCDCGCMQSILKK